jgi:hypothetical protein
MTYSLRWQRLVVVCGLLIVASGWIGYSALTWHSGSTSTVWTRSNLLFGIASVVGYAILAAASWAWFRWIERSPVTGPYDGRTMTLAAVSYGLEFFGFMLAAIALLGRIISGWCCASQPVGSRRGLGSRLTYSMLIFSSLSRLAAMDSRTELDPLIHDPPSLRRSSGKGP